ncbi:MAG: beta-glucosidase [Clostridiales bacterium]|nr:beta-glucosidase [Clostridiales bacterium]
MTSSCVPFPRDFVWGAATSAYQIEGGWNEDGKDPSVWDHFCHTPGHIHNGETGDIACDHYHRVSEDVALMKELGITSYRFSINWPRILPDGNGPINHTGLDFYSRLIDHLLEADIEPCVTLHHWELPLALHRRGGWLNPETAKAFSRLAEVVGKAFRGRVRRYLTLNEPQCITALGYGNGVHAPGNRTDPLTQAAVAHQLLLGHGYAVQALRSTAGTVEVGVASTGSIVCPAEDTVENRAVACDATFRCGENWTFMHSWFLDPMVLGHYPEQRPPELDAFVQSVSPDELAQICQPLDFIAANIYSGDEIDAGGRLIPRPTGWPRTALRWSVSPKSLHYGPAFLYRRYHLPIYVSENGQSCNDRIFLDGQVHDPDRIDYLQRYLLALRDAIREGVPVMGYYHWSLMDNFEWQSGYDDRFGLIFVDYANKLRRIPKDSFYAYRQIIASNGGCLNDPGNLGSRR